MPAPAVIPAPRAYINAVAVKGFVVELRGSKLFSQVPLVTESATAALVPREHFRKQTSRKRFLSTTHAMYAERRPCVLL